MNSGNIQLYMKISDIWRWLVANHQEDRQNSPREGFIFLMGYSGPNYRQFLRNVPTKVNEMMVDFQWDAHDNKNFVRHLSSYRNFHKQAKVMRCR